MAVESGDQPKEKKAEWNVVLQDAINGEVDVDTVACQPWSGWCAVEKCKICRVVCNPSFEVAWYHFLLSDDKEQGQKKKQDSSTCYYVSEMCSTCVRKILKRDPELRTQAYWDKKWNLYRQYREMGLLDAKWLESVGVKEPNQPV